MTTEPGTGPRTVLLFGQSASSVSLLRDLADRGTRVTAILDNNPAKQGTTQDGVPVVPVAHVLDAGNEAVVVIASRHHAAMAAQLRELGFAGEIAVADASGAPAGNLDLGTTLLACIRAERPRAHLIVCPYDALGDAYWAMAFLPAHLAARGTEDVAVVVTGAGCREVARLFGVEPVATLAQAEADGLIRALAEGADLDHLVAHHDRQYPGHAVPGLDRGLVPFVEQYRRVYGLPATAEPVAPDCLLPFDDESVPAGRSVILAPHAKSVLPPPPSFWADVVREHAARGLTVLTNVVGDEEPLPGTSALRAPLAGMVAAVERAGAFVGLRSGLCDVVHTARARKTAVFPDALYSTTSYRVADFFALPGWESVIAPSR